MALEGPTVRALSWILAARVAMPFGPNRQRKGEPNGRVSCSGSRQRTARRPSRRRFRARFPNWREGDTIHLGKRTLAVIGKRDDDVDQPPVLVVEVVVAIRRRNDVSPRFARSSSAVVVDPFGRPMGASGSRATAVTSPPKPARLQSHGSAMNPVPDAGLKWSRSVARSSCGSGTCPSVGGGEVLRLHAPQTWCPSRSCCIR